MRIANVSSRLEICMPSIPVNDSISLSRRHEPAARRKRSQRLGVEQLEVRRVLAADVQLVADLNVTQSSNGLNANYFSLTPVSNVLFFAGTNQESGQELWRSDGTADGTYLVKDIRPMSWCALAIRSS